MLSTIKTSINSNEEFNIRYFPYIAHMMTSWEDYVSGILENVLSSKSRMEASNSEEILVINIETELNEALFYCVVSELKKSLKKDQLICKQVENMKFKEIKLSFGNMKSCETIWPSKQ